MKIRTDDDVDRHLRQGQGQDRQGHPRRPASASASTSRASTWSSATSARTPAARTRPVGVIEKEGPIHVSNVAILDPKDKKPTRVRHRRRNEQGARMRVTKRSGAELD